ncbi:protein disulfide oxidoreductase [Malaciobacter halophilus]|uniref:Protein disulfide oxidoreductase n=1 Tax=Malaciobacter halophilus TaxID=197482 RepID=A0A2N1J6W7_9BACT|nr:redoxin domain-containing protein [Malaciobacter halophilus]AXH09985.1 putative copper tolerance-associated protein, TlpA-like family [Malaciobacter halophilus]PKI82202.1 protein disulfide oxidoreductase [Malaciobacter halophilus]
MKNKIKKYIKEILFFIITLTVILNIISYYKSLNLNKNNLQIFSFKLLNEKKYNIPKDKPVIIHFWATWCPTCKLEASNIEKLSKDYEVITIAVQSKNKENIKKYLENNKLSFKVVDDTKGYYSKKFNIKAFPTTLIYDNQKNLKFSEVGYTSTLGLYARMWWIQAQL